MRTLQPLSEVILYASPRHAYMHVRLGKLQLHWRAGVQRTTRKPFNRVENKEPLNE